MVKNHVMDKNINKAKVIDDLLLLVAQKNKKYNALQASHEKLVEALEPYVDDEPCSFDHHGCCQTHYGDPCMNTAAKQALAEAKDVGK